MAIHDCILGTEPKFSSDPNAITDNVIAQESLDALTPEVFLCDHISSPIPFAKLLVDCILKQDPLPLLEKIYVIPDSIDFGFIVNDNTAEIKIWSSKSISSTVIQIQQVNFTGLTLDAKTPPFELTGETEITIKVTALKDGPPIQNSALIITIDSQSFTIPITGKRIFAFPWEANWATPPKMRFGFLTVINKNKRFNEQRRSRFDLPIREQTADFAFEDDEAERFINSIRELSTKVLAIPIYKEAFYPTEDLQGLTTFNVEDISSKANLNNSNLTQFIIIKSLSDERIAEIQQINSLTATTVTINTPVVADYKQSDTVIYPIFVGTMINGSPEQLTGRIIKTSIEFKELYV